MNSSDYHWAKYPEKKLLSLSFRELNLDIQTAPFAPWIEVFENELAQYGIRFKPHFWISEEWFSPEGIPGVAIPFYLCHSRLKTLHRKMLYAVDGSTKDEFLRILRHEAGHAFDTAFGLSRRKSWAKHFGNPKRPYPKSTYTPNPYSNRYVHNIRFWYAQSHPSEDFAETFAVCIRSDQNWRRRYRKAPIALKKLEYVQKLLKDISGKKPKINSRKQIDPASRSSVTLGEFFAREREKYQLEEITSVDNSLLKLFSRDSDSSPVKAHTFLKKNKAKLRKRVGTWTNVNFLVVEYILEEFIERAEEMKLYLKGSSDEALLDTLCLLTHEVALISTTKRGMSIPF